MLKADMIDTRLRVLSHDEIHGVAGGDIVVNASRQNGIEHWYDRMSMFTYDYSNGFFSGGGGGGGGSSASPPPELVDTDGDNVPDSPEIVVSAPNEAQQTAALNQFSLEQSMLPVSYFGFSGAFGLGLGFKFIYDAQTGEWDVDVAGTAGVGFFVEGGAATDNAAANDASEATDDGWWIVGKVGGSAGGGAGQAGSSVGGQFGAGGMVTDSGIIP